MASVATSTLKQCPLCRDFCTRQISVLIKHIGLVHANKATLFHIVCGLGGCQKRFTNFRTYRNHLYSVHTDSDASSNPEPTPVPIASLVCGNGDDGGDDEEDGTSTAMQDHTTSSDLLQEAAARFVLKTKETHRLTQTVMNSIIEDTTSFSQIMLGELHYATTEKLTAAGVNPQIIGSLAPLFRDSGKFGRPFQGLETTYRQMKYFQQHFNFKVRL